ncbi:hypothetical protein chiPu_0032456, partial [Chiloscyllium punctatum]|nr:hypothetical protein [Chiloscyllium punctatum]
GTDLVCLPRRDLEDDDCGQQGKDDGKRRAGPVEAEEYRRPGKVKSQLRQPDSPADAQTPLPNTPARDGDQQVDDRPSRSKHPVGRIERSLVQGCVPGIGPVQVPDGKTGPEHRHDEQDQPSKPHDRPITMPDIMTALPDGSVLVKRWLEEAGSPVSEFVCER